MRFSILGSGSSGNAALLVTEGARILIDAGFSARKLEQLLAAVGESLARIDAALRELPEQVGDEARLLALIGDLEIAVAVPDQAVAIEQHDADIGPVEIEISVQWSSAAPSSPRRAPVAGRASRGCWPSG